MSNAAPGVALRPMTPADVPEVLAAQQPGAVIGLAKVFPQDEFPFPRTQNRACISISSFFDHTHNTSISKGVATTD